MTHTAGAKTASKSLSALTDDILVQDGRYNYKILLPFSPTEKEVFAAEELKYFLSKTTGCSPELIKDCGILPQGKYLSIGKTRIMADECADISYLGAGGFIIRSVAQGVILTGDTGDGTLYAVYEFLKRTTGMRFYAQDEIFIPKTQNISLHKFDIKDKPDFDYRYVGMSVLTTYPEPSKRESLAYDSKLYAARMRLQTGNEVNNLFGGLWAHTSLKNLLPPDKYYAAHPEWYSENKHQLCFSSEAARIELSKNLKDYIKSNPQGVFYMIGTEDNPHSCNCAACTEAYVKYGGFSGLHMKFVNETAKEIEEWRKQFLPDRKFYITVFAYSATRKPPAVYDKEKKIYKAFHPDIVAPENVAVFVAPIGACFYHGIFQNDCNHASQEMFLGWSAISKNILVWDYNCYFDNTILNYPNFDALKSNFKRYKEYGAKLVYNEACLSTKIVSFEALRVWLQANQMWNVDCDTQALTLEFFENYYKEAAPYISEYFYKVKDYYAILDKKYSKKPCKGYHTSIYVSWQPDVLTSEHWDKDFLNDSLSVLNKALQKLNQQKSPENQVMIKRVIRETLFIRYLLLELYSLDYDIDLYTDEINAFKKDAADCGINRLSNRLGGTVDALAAKWIDRWPILRLK